MGEMQDLIYSTTMSAVELGERKEQDRIIKLLDKHVCQFEVEHKTPDFKWKQRCRCGFYGVFNEHLIALIKGEHEAYEQVTPQQAQINEIFKQASRDIANMPSNLSFEERGRGIDAIMGNARADADAVREGKKVMSENKKQFYTYEQNNSGGFWKAPAISVVVEASSEDEADTIAKQNGVYFFDEHDDCPGCCGSRWGNARGPYQQIPEINAFDLRWEEISGIPAQLVVTKDE